MIKIWQALVVCGVWGLLNYYFGKMVMFNQILTSLRQQQKEARQAYINSLTNKED